VPYHYASVGIFVFLYMIFGGMIVFLYWQEKRNRKLTSFTDESSVDDTSRRMDRSRRMLQDYRPLSGDLKNSGEESMTNEKVTVRKLY
jgi:hypothetical protein